MAILLRNVNPTILGNLDNTIEVINNLFVGGKVGIGESSPVAKLEIAKNGINVGTISFEDESSNAHLMIKGVDSRVRLLLGTFNNGNYAGWIQASYDNSPNGSGTSGTEPLALNPQGGAVGIGVASPSSTLDVFSATNSEMRLSTTSTGFLKLGQYDNGAYIGTSSSNTTYGPLRLGTGGTERFRIDLNGNVRIGTGNASPRANLDLSDDGARVVIGGTGQGGYLRFGGDNSVNAIEYASSALNYHTNQTFGHRFYKNGFEILRIGLNNNPDSRLEIFGRARMHPDGTYSSGIWFAGRNDVSSSFLGRLSPADDSQFGLYHNHGWKIFADEKRVIIGTGVDFRMSRGGRLFVTEDIYSAEGGGIYFESNPNYLADYGFFREAGPWAAPFPGFRLACHTGLKIGAHTSHNGVRFYNNSDMGTLIFSVGDGDNKIKAFYGASIYTTLTIFGNDTAPAISYGNSVPNNPLHTSFYGDRFGIGMDEFTAGIRIVGEKISVISDTGYYSGNILKHANWVSLLKVMASGDVGIGTANPSAKLHVIDPGSYYPVRFQGNGVQGSLYTDSSSVGIFGTDSRTGLYFSPVGHELTLRTNYIESLRINPAGNVGIGITSPAYRLDVNPSIVSRSTLSSPRFSNAGTYVYGVTNSPNWNLSCGSVVNNNATAPDGTTSAGTYTLNSTCASYDLYQTITGLTNGRVYTIGMWVKLGTATNFCLTVNNTLNWNTISGKAFTSSDGLSTSKWTHISFTFTAPETGKINLHLGHHAETAVAQQTAGTVFIWNTEMTEFSSTWIGNVEDEIRLPGSSIWTSRGNVGIGTTTPTERLQVAGIICSTTGGIKYPDGTVQTTAAGVISMLPTGSIITFATSSAPSGFLLCDGAAISRTTYSALFALVGVIYGAGNGSTTFNVPDLRGEFVRGWDAGRGVDPGRTFASGQSSENKSHNHRPLFDNMFFPDQQVEAYNIIPNSNSDRGGGARSSGRRNLTIENTGGTESRPRNIALSYCIKT